MHSDWALKTNNYYINLLFIKNPAILNHMMAEQFNKQTSEDMASEGSALVTLEPSDFPRLCRVPHMLKDWRIQLPRWKFGDISVFEVVREP